MSNLTAVTATFGLLVCSACAAGPQVDQAAEREALRAAADEYHRLASSLDVEGLVAMYDAGTVAFAPCMEQIDGVDGMRAFAEAFTSAPSLQMSFETAQVEVSASGDMGYTVAMGEIAMDGGPDGSRLEERMHDVHVWRKQADGSWKVVLDVWNSPAPLPCPPE